MNGSLTRPKRFDKMTKALAIKKRNILFKYIGPCKTSDEIKRIFFHQALKFFGELGFSEAHIKFLEFNEKNQTGILTCARDYYEKVLGFLAIIQIQETPTSSPSEKPQPIRFRSLNSSGTINKLKKSSLQ